MAELSIRYRKWLLLLNMLFATLTIPVVIHPARLYSTIFPESLRVTTPVATKQPIPQIQPTITTPGAGYSVLGPPTLSASFINQVLAYYKSPASGTGQDLSNLGLQYSIDPAFALAFLQHESRCGRLALATAILSIGNERCISDYPCYYTNDGGYAQFTSWQQGYLAWYQLIRYYIDHLHLLTIDQIIPT